jgi:hypothetical protein
VSDCIYQKELIKKQGQVKLATGHELATGNQQLVMNWQPVTSNWQPVTSNWSPTGN